MKKDEFKKWVKEHKKGILIGVGATVALIALKPLKKWYDYISWEQELPLDLKTGCVESATEYMDYIETYLCGIKSSDMGDLGKELAEKLPNVTEDTTFYAILNYMK